MAEFSHPVFGKASPIPQHVLQAPPPPQPEPPQELAMADNDLQSLIECGRITDEIMIDGKKFVMSTLADDIQEDLFKKFAATPAEAANFLELRRTIVASAMETYNDRPVESMYPANAEPQADVFSMKLAIVRKMQPLVLDKLYGFYEELIKRSKQKIDPEQVKNS